MKNDNALVGGIVAVVCVIILGATAVLLFAPEGTDVAPLLGLAAPTVAALGALAVSRRQGSALEDTKSTVEDLANGKMDAKIRAAIASVMLEEHIDPAYDDAQRQADEARSHDHEH